MNTAHESGRVVYKRVVVYHVEPKLNLLSSSLNTPCLHSLIKSSFTSGDIRFNFFFSIVASGSKETLSTIVTISGRGPTTNRLLSNEEIRGTRPNRRVVWVTKDQTDLPIDVQVLCADDDLDTTDLFTVCHFEGQWHSIQWSKTKQRFHLGHVYPEIDEWNIDSDSEHETDEKTQSDKDEPIDNTNRLI